MAIALLFLFWSTVPTTAASSPLKPEAEDRPTEAVIQPIKIYYLKVLPEVGRREVNTISQK